MSKKETEKVVENKESLNLGGVGDCKISRKETIPAIPPEDYTGSIGMWHIALIENNLWDGKGWHGDVELNPEDWWKVLEICEG